MLRVQGFVCRVSKLDYEDKPDTDTLNPAGSVAGN